MTPEMQKYIKKFSNFVINDFKAVLNKHKLSVDNCGIAPKELRLFFDMQQSELIDKKQLKQILNNRMTAFKEKQNEIVV